MDHYEQAAEIMKALGHPLRLQILEELRREGEACVCHLEARLGQRQAIISQHLARLREAKLVIDHREGMNVYYALADDSISALVDEGLQVADKLQSVEPGRAVSRFKNVRHSKPCPCPKCTQRRAALPASVPAQQ